MAITRASGLNESARRLHARRAELEQAAFARIRVIADPDDVTDPAYLAGLRDALAAALDYGLEAVTSPNRAPGPVPLALLSQARLAARNGVGIEAILRRYSSGHTLLADTLLEEAVAIGADAAELKASLQALAARYEGAAAFGSRRPLLENLPCLSGQPVLSSLFATGASRE